jgi:hypothetical protein
VQLPMLLEFRAVFSARFVSSMIEQQLAFLLRLSKGREKSFVGCGW